MPPAQLLIKTRAMQRLLYLAIITISLIAFGCNSDSSDGNGTDGGTDAGIDASTVDPGGNPDTVTVALVDEAGDPVVGRSVIFHDAQGLVLSTAVTDAEGKVASTDADGGMVTVVTQDSASNRSLWTIGFVALGQVIEVPIVDNIIQGLGTLNISLAGAVAGAANYTVSTACDEVTANMLGALSLALDEECISPGQQLPVFAGAYGSSGDLLSYTTDVLANFPTQGDTEDITLPAWKTPQSWNVTVNNALAWNTLGVFDASYIADGLAVLIPTQSNAMPTGGTASLTTSIPQDADKTAQSMLLGAFATDPGTAQSASIYSVRTSGSPSALDIDGQQDLLPVISGVDVTPGNGAVVTTIEWTYTGSTGAGIYLENDWDEGQVNYRWAMVLPPQTTSPFSYPTLPAGFSAWRPTVADPDDLGTQLFFLEADFISTFDELRKILAEQPFDDGPPTDPTGNDSVVKASFYASGGFN